MTKTYSSHAECPVFTGNARGLTLVELTLTISVILGLVSILFAGSSIYSSHAHRASCVVAQDQLRKAITADASMRKTTFHPGIDYYAKAVEGGVLGNSHICPQSGGTYTATVDVQGGRLTISCSDFGGDHQHN